MTTFARFPFRIVRRLHKFNGGQTLARLVICQKHRYVVINCVHR